MSEQWRVIKDFPRYMISPEGEVRTHMDGKLIVPVVTEHREYVRLYRDGRIHNRSIRKLVEITYPPSYVEEVFEDWVEIPGFVNYEMNRFGRVRKKTTKREVKVQTSSGTFVNLNKYGRTYRRSINGLMRLCGHNSETGGE